MRRRNEHQAADPTLDGKFAVFGVALRAEEARDAETAARIHALPVLLLQVLVAKAHPEAGPSLVVGGTGLTRLVSGVAREAHLDEAGLGRRRRRRRFQMRLQEIFEVRIVEDDSELAARLLSEVLVNSDLGGQADDGATHVRLLARFYRLVYVARVAGGQASHYYHHLKKRRGPRFIDDIPFSMASNESEIKTHFSARMTWLVPERLQRGIERVLQTWLPAAVANALFHHASDTKQVLFGIAGELGDDLGPLVPRRDQPELADRIEVEKLIDELFDDFEGASQPRRLEVLHGHVFRHVQNDV